MQNSVAMAYTTTSNTFSPPDFLMAVPWILVFPISFPSFSYELQNRKNRIPK